MNKQLTQRELAIKLIHEVREQSHKYASDQPVCYPFVAGFLEMVLKSLPENDLNYRHLQRCIEQRDQA